MNPSFVPNPIINTIINEDVSDEELVKFAKQEHKKQVRMKKLRKAAKTAQTLADEFAKRKDEARSNIMVSAARMLGIAADDIQHGR